jgi:hypothetical protein
MLSPQQHTQLDELINGNEGELDEPDNLLTGAVMTVYNQDDPSTHVFQAPLARMWRHAPDEDIIWLRPIVTTIPEPHRPVSQDNGFGLAANRRRSISYTTVTTTDTGGLHFHTTMGQIATIEPLNLDTHRNDAQTLVHWDTFTLVILPNETVSALEELTEDSWHGEWA